ncbi:anhydro-N-acetylmuramic acid kinase, partial [Micrococcus luteus]|nr:anhydro-N-acetylmuramic acid kinase [Micrococcus luteus]
RLNQSGPDELRIAAEVSLELARLYAEVTQTILLENGLVAEEINALGIHGQTVRHRPEHGYSIQLNAPALVAELTGIDVIADFRSRD